MSENKVEIKFRSAYDLGKPSKGQTFDPVYTYEYIRDTDGKLIKNKINMQEQIDSVTYLTSSEIVERGENNVGNNENYIDGRDLPVDLDGLIAYIERIKTLSKTPDKNPEDSDVTK